MSKFPGIPKLVNVSDTSDSESIGSTEGDEKDKSYRSKSQSLERSRSGSHRSVSPSPVKESSVSNSFKDSRRRSRSRSRGQSRRSRSQSRDRRHHRHDRHGSRERRRSRDRRRHRRSPSPRRHRRRTRSKSPRRHRSPPRPSRSSKTMATLDKLGIELKPTDPNAIPTLNPARFSQQIAKRKLIWGNKAANDGNSLWQGATFSQDQDGKMTSKFKRLMGIKESESASGSGGSGEDLIKRQQELFSSMELQYEAARQATHTQRGVGLGFGAALHHP